jgi:hypothetical protein
MRKVLIATMLATILASCSSSAAPSELQEIKAKSLSKACDATLEPVRVYARAHTDALTEEVRTELKALMIKSYDSCTQPELRLFRDVFLTPWAESIAEAGSKAGSEAE